jgi:hypothetical protein
MAYFEGHPDEKAKKSLLKYFFLIVIVTLMLIFFSVGSTAQWKEKLVSLSLAAVFIILIISVVTIKINPMGWLQLFNPEKFQHMLSADKTIFNALKQLGDSYFVFYDFNLELFHVEILVIGPKGIFVIGRILLSNPKTDRLQVQNNILYAGTRPLMKKTATLWRISHLIHMIIKKGYQTEIMPQPILVVSNSDSETVHEFDGIAIMTPNDLCRHITFPTGGSSIDMVIVKGFAHYIKEKYC